MTDRGAAQCGIKAVQGIRSANLHHDILSGDGLLGRRRGFASSFRRLHRAGKADLGKVAIGQGALFCHRLHGGTGIANAGQFGVELGIGQLRSHFLDFNVLISIDGEFRNHFEGRFEA